MSKTTTVKRILVPLELNKAGEDLLFYAGQLAIAFGAELFLFHACKTTDLTFTQQSSCIHRLRTFGERVLAREHVVNKTIPPYDCIVRPGSVQDSVKSVTEDFKIDLILITAQGEGADSPAATIMDAVGCPVIVVPSTARYKKVNHLIFATDFTDQNNQILLKISHFASQLKAKLTLVQVYTASERNQLSTYRAAMQEVKELLPQNNVCLRLLEEEDVLEGVSEFSELEAADMLVLATQDNYLLKRLFSNSYLKTMAYHTRIPILTYRQLKKKPCSGCCANCAKKSLDKQLHQEVKVL